MLAETLTFVDVFAPSIDELLFVFDRQAHERLRAGAELATVVDRSRLAELGDTLIGMGASVVAIKLGDQGLYLRTTDDARQMREFCDRVGLVAEAWCAREVFSPCFRPRVVVGTTGSGDSTIAGLLAALLRGASPCEAATSATAVGACSVEAMDPTSGIPTWPQVAARLANRWPRLPVDIALGSEVAVERDDTGTMVLV